MRKEHFPVETSSPRTYQHLSPTLYLNYNSSKFSMSLDYREQQTIPSIEDTRHYLDNSSPLFLRTGNPDLKQSILRSAGLGFGFNSSITSHFELSLDTETSIGQNLLDGTKVYGYLSENMKANFRANFFSRLWLGSDFNWTWLGTDEANAPGFHRESWNASVSYTLGKKDQVKLGLEWIDILNRNNTWKTSIEENYILSSFSAMYGTSILLRLEWKF